MRTLKRPPCLPLIQRHSANNSPCTFVKLLGKSALNKTKSSALQPYRPMEFHLISLLILSTLRPHGPARFLIGKTKGKRVFGATCNLNRMRINWKFHFSVIGSIATLVQSMNTNVAFPFDVTSLAVKPDKLA